MVSIKVTLKISLSEILSSLTFVAGHFMLLKSLDWTNTSTSFIFLTVSLYDERIAPIHRFHCFINNVILVKVEHFKLLL